MLGIAAETALIAELEPDTAQVRADLAPLEEAAAEDEIEAVGTLDFSNLSEDELIQLLELEGKIEVRPPDPDRRR